MLGIGVVGLLLFVSGVLSGPVTTASDDAQVDGAAQPWRYRPPDGPSAPPSEARVLEAELDEDGQSDASPAVFEAAFAHHVAVETPPKSAMREFVRRGGLVCTGLPRGPPATA